MKIKDDFINKEKNKKNEIFPIGQHKPVIVIGADKDKIEIEYAKDEEELKHLKNVFKRNYNSVKVIGVFAGRYNTDIFEL